MKGSWTLAALVAADLAFAFQQTAVVPAIPAVQHDLHASQAWSAWLLTGYLVASSVATPLLGKVGDRRGRRRALVGSLAGYLLGSIGAALAPDLAVLVVFRAVQGLGGAIFPLTLSLARDQVPEERVGLAVGALTGAFGLGRGAGFAASGFVVESLSWRWLFAVGAALVAAGIAAVLLAPAADEGRREGGLDVPGTLLLAGGLSALLVALTIGAPIGFGAPWTVVAFVLSAALIAGWVRVDLRAEDPLIDLRVLGRPAVLLTNLTTIGLGYVLFGVYFLVPELLSTGRGLSAGASGIGLYLLPSALGQAVAGPAAGALAGRVAPKWIAGGGMTVLTAAAALLAGWHDRPWQLAAWLALLGIGAGAGISVVSDLAAELVEQTETGAATGLNSTLRRASGGVGGQAAAILLAGGRSGFTPAFAISAGVAAAGAAAALAIRRR